MLVVFVSSTIDDGVKSEAVVADEVVVAGERIVRPSSATVVVVV
jgi:hypothetical protein